MQRLSPIQGVGLGLRSEHYQDILSQRFEIPWFEMLADNYLIPSTPARIHLNQIAERFPLAMHSVNMSIGGVDEFDWEYLTALKQLADEVKPSIISDHLCFSTYQGEYFHDLLPLPYTEECLQHVIERVKRLQDFFGQHLLIENPSSYLKYDCSQMSEWEFLSALANQADCYILLDVNNVYVSGINHQFDPSDYYRSLPSQRVAQLHLAGYKQYPNYLLDSHGAPVSEPVWQLFRDVIKTIGSVPTLIEWDNDIPELTRLLLEAEKAGNIIKEVQHETRTVDCAI